MDKNALSKSYDNDAVGASMCQEWFAKLKRKKRKF